ncbi:MAG: hypothetical protein ACR2J0_08490 [Mycobacteriales bacterium]
MNWLTSAAGTPISRKNLRSKVWLPAVTSAGLFGKVTFHGPLHDPRGAASGC